MCHKKVCGCIVPIIISIIIAIIIGVLFTTTVVTGLTTLLYIILGVAAFFLLTLVVTIITLCGREKCCICDSGKCLLVGSLGSIIFSGILISITVTETVTAILFGIVTFFIVLAIIEFFKLILCLINANCIDKE